MWLYTSIGFFSVIDRPLTRKGRKDATKLQVRARVRADLERLNERLANLNAEGRIVLTPDADYPCRMLVDRKAFQKVIAQLVSEIDYADFKSHVHDQFPHEPQRQRALDLAWEGAKRWGDFETERTALTPARIDELLAFQKVFANRDYRPVVRESGAVDLDEDTFAVRPTQVTQEVENFFAVISQPWWQAGGYGNDREILENPKRLAVATLEEVRSALLFCQRGQHFNDGFWDEVFERHWPQALLARLADIRRGISKTKLPQEYVKQNSRKRPEPKVVTMTFVGSPSFTPPKLKRGRKS